MHIIIFKTLEVISVGKNFWNIVPFAQEIVLRINNLDNITLKNICIAKGTINEKVTFRIEKKIASDSLDRGLIFRLNHELKELDPPK